MRNFSHLLYEEVIQYSQEEVEGFHNLCYDGVVYQDYKIGPCGNIFSKRNKTEWKQLKPQKSPKQKYPHIHIGRRNIRIHRIVCETFHPQIPCPPGINIEVWNTTHPSLKHIIKKEMMEVNHKDHNKSNFHPDNLEWVTRRGNRQAYKKHRNK